METRIVTSVYWKKQTKFIVAIDILIAFAVVIFSLVNKDLEMFLVLGVCTLFYISITLLTTFFVRRLLTDVFANESGFKSMLFNKKMAFVDNRKKVYYAIFEEAEGVYSRRKFILISNAPFKYETRKSSFSKSMIGHYDIHTQILIPYNSDTVKFFDFKNGVCVN